MIYKRVAARLHAQDWVAIMIELGIVVLGSQSCARSRTVTRL